MFVDPETKKFALWSEIRPDYTFDQDMSLAEVLVPTIETTRLQQLVKSLLAQQSPVMLVGPAGSGKVHTQNFR